jgi:DNA-binding XRE family transcriptional regulator
MPLLYFYARSADISSSGNPIEWTDMKQQQTTRPGPTERSGTALSARSPAPARRSTGRTQDIDRHVGARVRERRIMLGLTQQQLADLIGVTYQQAHKYERGINRVSAGRLYEIAQVLSVPVG